jgi:hypothetical protein
MRQFGRVVIFDQRWHGAGITSSRFRLEDCADDAVVLAAALGIHSFIPVTSTSDRIIRYRMSSGVVRRREGLRLRSMPRDGQRHQAAGGDAGGGGVQQ